MEQAKFVSYSIDRRNAIRPATPLGSWDGDRRAQRLHLIKKQSFYECFLLKERNTIADH
jgi:hypothetical protein